jgi:hypothetical protein
MSAPSKVQFHPRWKEELVCTMDGHTFIVEITMGVLKVYFPAPSRWEAAAPDWAKGQWERVHADLNAWCSQERIPLIIEEQAWVNFD